jgi:hypothetical protein
MEINLSGSKIELDKELNELDELVLDFVKLLNRNRVNYVLVSGYVSILFGRSRSSEDIDIIVEKIPREQFAALWRDITKSFLCVSAGDPGRAYDLYLMAPTSLRFYKEGRPVPNIEFKFPKTELDRWTLENSRSVILNRKPIMISAIELQIAYKLFLGSEKDIEDARYLYRVLYQHLDQEELKFFLEKLDKTGDFNRYLG